MRSFATALFLATIVAGCATAPETPPPAKDTFWRASASVPEEVEAEKRRTGQITRAELEGFLDQGPAQLLRAVPIEPVLEGNDLVGFRVRAFFAGDERFAPVDVVPGDIITAVNGTQIVRPGDLYAVWEELRGAPRLQVDVIRGTTLYTLSWEIVDGPEGDPDAG